MERRRKALPVSKLRSMILSPGSSFPAVPLGLPVLVLALGGYLLALWPARGANAPRWPAVALLAGWVAHFLMLALVIGGFGSERGVRLGFAPVLSATVWMMIAGHAIESRMLPLPSVRWGLGLAGAAAALLAYLFPGEPRHFATPLGPLHFVLGVTSYGLFGAAVLHALLLDGAERRLRQRGAGAPAAQGMTRGMPLLQLERLTFRFVAAGFAVLSLTLMLGIVSPAEWRWDHKTVLAMMAWAVFAALLLGRRLRGWRGMRATRWLYGGTLLLLLAYVGSRFVLEVLLERGA